MLHGGAHISSSKRAAKFEAHVAPPYHWGGFGRESCKPLWYDGARDKKPLDLWEGDACGCPKVVPKKLGIKAPYNHSDDDRMYRPTVPLDLKTINQYKEATRNDRQLISRGAERMDRTGRYVEHGVADKYARYTAMSCEVREDYNANKKKSVQTEMKDIIFRGKQEHMPLPYSRTRSDFFKSPET